MWRCCFRVQKYDRFFLENGGQLLEELISVCDGKSNPIKNFSLKEIEKMTSNFAVNQQLRTYTCMGWFYKGTLDDDYFVVVDICYWQASPSLKKTYIHNIAITSHVNHKNIVKLLGCCLESEVPVPVYEFCANGALSNHIYEIDRLSTGCQLLPWQSRLRVATEIADAITYLHIANSNCIVHRNIMLDNILLDRNYVAKVSDFSKSVCIPFGETHVKVDGLGYIMGYLAPECCKTFEITEKADVFNFGVILLELLTGLALNDFVGVHVLADHLMVPSYVRSVIENNSLGEIIAPTILKEGVIEQQLLAFTELSMRCRDEIAENRPIMIAVAKELRQIKRLF